MHKEEKVSNLHGAADMHVTGTKQLIQGCFLFTLCLFICDVSFHDYLIL